MSKLGLLGYLESSIDVTAVHLTEICMAALMDCMSWQECLASSVHKGTAYCLGQVDHGADCYCMLCVHGQKQSCRGADLRKRKRGGGKGGERVAYKA